jgi:hypothetical protein
VNHLAPVAIADYCPFLFAEASLFKCRFRAGQKFPAMLGDDEIVQKSVQAVGSNAGVEREGISSFYGLDAFGFFMDAFEVRRGASTMCSGTASS